MLHRSNWHVAERMTSSPQWLSWRVQGGAGMDGRVESCAALAEDARETLEILRWVSFDDRNRSGFPSEPIAEITTAIARKRFHDCPVRGAAARAVAGG